MCGRGGELFIQISSKSCIKCGLRGKSCSNFLQQFFCPLCLILPTLHICGPTNFPSRSHIGKMGVTRSQRLCYSTPTKRAGRTPFITFTTRSTAVAVECPRFYQGWLCCRCPGRHSNLAGVYCCPIEGILTWEKHSQAFQEDKGKSQLAIWVTWLDGFRPAFFLLSLNCRDGNSCLPAVDFTKTRVWLS